VASRIADLSGLELRGVFTHAGHAYLADSADAVAEVGRDEGRQLADVAAELRRAGLGIREVSVGSTPTARQAMTVAGVTECRPGNYVYHDASQVGLGTCGLADCAMTVAATVVSVPAPGRAVLDAGSKTLSTDPLRPRGEGHGLVLGTSSRLSRLSEEHGVIDVAPGDAFRVGQRVRVLPNHACVVSNLHDFVYGVRGDRVEARFAVAARGRVT
jgi:D-serine deaminase-like pyridoxal phosphate-dependent protein